jgi:outer membrane protein OmpA-like peptidoglycan-associated protein
MKWIVFAVGLSSLSLVSCRAESPPVSTSLQSAPATVTQLEPPTLIESTKLETSSNPSTTTTITPVQQAITDLKAQRTPEGLRINLPENILFDFDKSEIQPNAKPTLQKLSILLKNYKNAPTEIRGHTDSKGNDDYNQDLSERRANAVKTYLVQNFQVNGDRLASKGFGKTQPIASNTKSDGSDDPEGRQKNRRVEVIIHNTAP